jgi:hypothetical protein
VLQKELQALSLSLDVKLKEKPEEKEVAND